MQVTKWFTDQRRKTGGTTQFEGKEAASKLPEAADPQTIINLSEDEEGCRAAKLQRAELRPAPATGNGELTTSIIPAAPLQVYSRSV